MKSLIWGSSGVVGAPGYLGQMVPLLLALAPVYHVTLRYPFSSRASGSDGAPFACSSFWCVAVGFCDVAQPCMHRKLECSIVRFPRMCGVLMPLGGQSGNG